MPKKPGPPIPYDPIYGQISLTVQPMRLISSQSTSRRGTRLKSQMPIGNPKQPSESQLGPLNGRNSGRQPCQMRQIRAKKGANSTSRQRVRGEYLPPVFDIYLLPVLPSNYHTLSFPAFILSLSFRTIFGND
jgi:hypothetical protein